MELADFLKEHPIPGKLLFGKVWGSRSHNLDMGTSDYDFAGVYVVPTREVLSLMNFKENMTHDTSGKVEKNKKENPDHSFHEVGRFCELLVTGNPNILEMVFTEKLCETSREWDKLRAIRGKFLSQQALKQYLGYMNGQLARLIRHDGAAGLHTKGGSYTEKWAYHILRLAGDAKRIAIGGGPMIWRTGEDRELLLKVRRNQFQWTEVQKMIEDAIGEIEALKPWNIREVGDRDALNEWLLDIRKNNW